MGPKHFQKPIEKRGYIDDILLMLGLVDEENFTPIEKNSQDCSQVDVGLQKMNRLELSVLHHYMWHLLQKYDATLDKILQNLEDLKAEMEARENAKSGN
jgi:hypothetical protein